MYTLWWCRWCILKWSHQSWASLRIQWILSQHLLLWGGDVIKNACELDSIQYIMIAQWMSDCTNLKEKRQIQEESGSYWFQQLYPRNSLKAVKSALGDLSIERLISCLHNIKNPQQKQTFSETLSKVWSHHNGIDILWIFSESVYKNHVEIQWYFYLCINTSLKKKNLWNLNQTLIPTHSAFKTDPPLQSYQS